MDGARFTVEKVEDVEVFASLRDEWNELLRSSSSDCLFLTWEWLFTWWKHLSADRRLHIVVVRSGGELAAIAPLALRPRRLRALYPLPSLEFLGTGSVGSDYLDLIARPDTERAALKHVAACLEERDLTVELAQMERDSACSVELGLWLKRHGWSPFRTTTSYCPFIDLSGHTWESYLAGLGRAHRYNFRRRFRQLDKRFRVRFVEARSERERQESLRLLVDLHLRRWSSGEGSDAFHTAGLVAFHEELSRLALQRGWLRLYVLWLDDAPAAAFYGFLYNGAFYFYQSGFDPRFRAYSVGLVTMGLALQRAIEEGAREFDLLHGDEQYKYLWAREERELVRLALYPPRAGGALNWWAMDLRMRLKRTVWRTLPPRLGEWFAPGRRMDSCSMTRAVRNTAGRLAREPDGASPAVRELKE